MGLSIFHVVVCTVSFLLVLFIPTVFGHSLYFCCCHEDPVKASSHSVLFGTRSEEPKVIFLLKLVVHR